MKKSIVVMLAGILTLAACVGSQKTERIVVASEQADCTGEGPQKCFLIRHEGGEGWELWYSGIEGFEYTSGYEYVLEIRKERDVDPPADRSAIRYILVKQVSKTEKVSEGMSPAILEERHKEEIEQLEMETEIME